MSDEGYYPEYSGNSFNSIAKIHNQLKNRGLNRHFSKRHIKANKYIKRCSISLVLGEMLIITTVLSSHSY